MCWHHPGHLRQLADWCSDRISGGFKCRLHRVLALDIRDKAPAPQDTTFSSKDQSTDIPDIHKSQ